jgi:hypothetical protein
MDRNEATGLLEEELARYAALPHARLVRLIEELDAHPVVAPSGIEYQVEISAIWVAEPGGTVQILAGIDDGTFRGALSPVTAGFLKRPDGSVDWP